MMKKLASALSLSLALAACGGDDGMSIDDTDPGTDPGGEEVDTTAPTVLSTSPTSGALGQPDDVTVSIVFSEPMDKESVEMTLDASSLGDVALSWNEAGDTITITPDAPLEYAIGIGDDPSTVNAKQYVVNLGSAALDLAGNPLGPGVQITFKTYKEMSITLEPFTAMTRSMTPAAVVFADDDPLVVGDDGANQGIRSGITFDIADLPDEAISISSATLATRQQTGDLSGAPFSDLGSSMSIDHVTYGALSTENAINAAFNSSQTSLGSADGFCVLGQVVIQFDVTDMVDDDLANRGLRNDLSQFLLSFATPTDLDGNVDRAVISRDLTELQVSYLAE